jgi:hypothetical protein
MATVLIRARALFCARDRALARSTVHFRSPLITMPRGRSPARSKSPAPQTPTQTLPRGTRVSMDWGKEGMLKGTVLRGSKKGYVVVEFDDGEEWNVSSCKLIPIGGVATPTTKTAKTPKATPKTTKTPKGKMLPQKGEPNHVDLCLAFFFAFSVFGNFTVDFWMGLDVNLLSTGWSYHKMVHDMASICDPLFLANKGYMRASALVTAIAFMPYYVLAIDALLRGSGLGVPGSQLRRYARVYAIGMFLNMTIVFGLEFKEFVQGSKLAPHLGFYWCTVLAYWVVPALVALRLRSEDQK